MTEPEGTGEPASLPYHGWTYSLAGELKGTPDFAGARDFEAHRTVVLLRLRLGRSGFLSRQESAAGHCLLHTTMRQMLR